jgi:ankyrin repeat protein
MPRLEELLAANPDPTEINNAFWQACHGGQRRAAEHLLRHGADINTTVEYAHGTALDAATGPDTRHDLLVTWLRENGAQHSKADD